MPLLAATKYFCISSVILLSRSSFFMFDKSGSNGLNMCYGPATGGSAGGSAGGVGPGGVGPGGVGPGGVRLFADRQAASDE